MSPSELKTFRTDLNLLRPQFGKILNISDVTLWRMETGRVSLAGTQLYIVEVMRQRFYAEHDFVDRLYDLIQDGAEYIEFVSFILNLPLEELQDEN